MGGRTYYQHLFSHNAHATVLKGGNYKMNDEQTMWKPMEQRT